SAFSRPFAPARASTTRRRRWRSWGFRCRTSGSARCWRSCSPSSWDGCRSPGVARRRISFCQPSRWARRSRRAPAARPARARASVIEELRELYVLAARARGLSYLRAVLRHAFRNSLIPIVTVFGLQFGAVLTGAVITETIFAWPGVGRLLVQSIAFRDYPLV